MLTSEAGVGASPTIATPRALALQTGGLQRRDPVGRQDLVRVQAAGRSRAPRGTRRHAAEGRRARSASASRRRRRRRPGRPTSCCRRELQAHPGDRVDVALDPLRQLRRVHGQRHLRARRGLVDLPLGPNIFCALPTLTVALARRCVTSTFAVIPLDLNAFTTPLRFDERRRIALQRRQRGYLPKDEEPGCRGLDRVLQTRLVRDETELSGSLRLVEAAPTVLRPLWEIGP